MELRLQPALLLLVPFNADYAGVDAVQSHLLEGRKLVKMALFQSMFISYLAINYNTGFTLKLVHLMSFYSIFLHEGPIYLFLIHQG